MIIYHFFNHLFKSTSYEKKNTILSINRFCFFVKAQTTITPTAFLITNRTMQPHFNGYNGTNTITQGQTWKDLAVTGVDAHLVSLFPDVLRYPGGTVANYWSWRDGRFLHNYEFTSGVSGLTLPQNFSTFNNYLDYNNDDLLDEFKKSSDLTGGWPIYDLNIFSSDYPNQLAMLFHAKEIGLPVENVELGNEFYNDFPAHRLVFPSVVDYATKAIQWAQALKSAPGLGSMPPKIAVVGSWELPASEGRQRVWLDNLIPEIDGVSAIDAVTMHQYLGTGFASLGSSAPVNGACLSELNTTEINVMLRSPFENIDALKVKEFAQIATINKEIWITEFNIGDHTYATFGSWAHGLMVSGMMLSYLEEPKVAKVITHALVGSAIAGAMFSDADGLDYAPGEAPYDPVDDAVNTANPCTCLSPSSTLNYNTKQWEKSASGSAVALISKAMHESTMANEIDFRNAPGMAFLDAGTGTQYPVLYGWRFTKNNTTEYVILNLSNAKYDVALTNLLPSTVASGSYESVSAPVSDYITGDNSLNSSFVPVYVPLTALTAPYYQTRLEAYSVTRIVLQTASNPLSLVATNTKICTNKTTTVTAYNLNPIATYTWSTSSTNASISTIGNFNNIAQFSATAAGTYTVTLSSGGATATCSITVANPPALTVTSTSTTICPATAAAVTLTASGCSSCTYIWTPSYGITNTGANPAMNASINVKPDSTTTYMVYASNGTCAVSNQASPITITSNTPLI